MNSRLLTAVFAVALFAASARADDPPALPADLKAVPADALGFVHVRVADIWKTDSLKDLRETIFRAGEKAVQGFDKRFLPHPSSIERLTVVLAPRDEKLQQEPDVFAILATSKAIDRDEFLKSALPGATEHKHKKASFFADGRNQVAVSFIDEKTLVFGPAPAVAGYCDRQVKSEGALADALRSPNTKRHISLAVNAGMIPEEAFRNVPPPALPLLKAKLVTAALDLTANSSFDIAFTYADEEQTRDAHDALRALAAMGRAQLKNARQEMLAKAIGDGNVAPLQEFPEAAAALFALGAFETIDELLADPPIKRQGLSLRASIKAPGIGGWGLAMPAVGVGLLLPAVQKVREAAARAQSQNNLKQIALALHNYHDANGAFPPAVACDKNGKPLYSWRVLILPYLEQGALYNQFKLDEPWDSEHNKPLSQMMVKVYMHPNDPNPQAGLCYYRVFYGKDALFGFDKGKRIADITDGTSNTIMVVEAAEGVPWAKPDDFAYDPKKPLPKFSHFFPGGFNVAFADGSVRFLSNSLPEEKLRALITANGGEVVDLDDGPPGAGPKPVPPSGIKLKSVERPKPPEKK